MDWKILAAISVVTDTAVVFIDNYVTDVYFKGRGAAAVKLFYGILFAILGPILILAAWLINGFNFENFTAVILFFVSGAISSFASIAYYKALEIDESTNISIFYQLAPILYLIGECLLFGAVFDASKMLAFLLIMAAPTLIIMSTRKKSRCKKVKSFLFAVLYVIISVAGNLVFLKGNLEYQGELDIMMSMAIIIFAKGLANLVIVFIFRPQWIKRFREVAKASKKKVYKPMWIYAGIYIIYDLTHRVALVLAPTAAVASAAIDSIGPVAVFFSGIILTIINPKFGREKLDKKTVIVNLAATALVVTGVILLQ